MKKLYWRPPHVSRTALALVAVLAVGVLILVESYPVVRKQDHYGARIAAARLSRDCMEAIKAEKQQLGHKLNPEVDPAETGMIGESLTPVTSNTGFLSAKLTSANPNFAALVVHLLIEAGVREGDVVTMAVSGSFPSLNVSAYAAAKTLGLDPIVIASTASSEWGANHVDYLWLDMERTLREKKLIDFGSVAATHGGIDDMGVGITDEGRALLDVAMERNGVRMLAPTSLADSIDKRMALYDEIAGNRRIKAYINVGGGSASVGTHVGKKQFKPGLNTEVPRTKTVADSVMLRFAKRDVPVIHLSRVKLLAERFGLPYEPRTAVPLGRGQVFVGSEYNRWLALGGLVAIMVVMFAFLRWDIGMRVLRGMRPRDTNETPEHMV
ncbi:MAG: poly-gamma-glutamate system protein [Deltaproteobacteria bacterium]|nr:poly-gamma-glutamate system protein [Deltaproteobacteria bacterium]